ncbi:hypothetical protein ACIBF6_44035 [Streptosporangium amethystogenes]|uniref:hypothetical protein n=1 Tax=Streptosporangium amethystogenes TaxID=2002 RepID=UPI00379C2BC1
MTLRRTPPAEQPVKPVPRLSRLVYRLGCRIRARFDEALVTEDLTACTRALHP